jgi:hypothetical protein
MYNVIRLLLASATLVVLGMFCSLAAANTVTIGNNNLGNLFPFSDDYSGQYQQVYSSSLFPGPVEITGITFFCPTGGCSGMISGDFTIELSTTSAGINTLSTNFTANLGSNNSLFFSGTVTNVLSFTGVPFLYNPSAGNLLIDVDTLSTPASNLNPFLAAGCSTDTNRAFYLGGTETGGVAIGDSEDCTSGSTSYGLETEFTLAPTPEPSSLFLLSTGLLVLGPLVRRFTLS